MQLFGLLSLLIIYKLFVGLGVVLVAVSLLVFLVVVVVVVIVVVAFFCSGVGCSEMYYKVGISNCCRSVMCLACCPCPSSDSCWWL